MGLSAYMVCRHGASKPVSHMSRTITMRNGSFAFLNRVRELATLVLAANVWLPVRDRHRRSPVITTLTTQDLALLGTRHRRPLALAQS